MPKMPLPQYPDQVKYLDAVKPNLLPASEPKEFRSQQPLEIEYLGGSSGKGRFAISSWSATNAPRAPASARTSARRTHSWRASVSPT